MGLECWQAGGAQSPYLVNAANSIVFGQSANACQPDGPLG